MKDYLIEKYLGEGKGLRKQEIFKKILDAISGSMDIDQMNKAVKLPISKHGLEAHMEELVKKGKLRSGMKKGKNIWMKI